jgi:membrane fusion protein, multidrug efflux system
VRSNKSNSTLPSRLYRWLQAGVYVTLAAGVSGCNANTGAAPAEKPATVPAGPPTIEVVRVVERPVDVTLAMPGQLDPYESVAVYPKITGFVTTIRVDRGSRVKAGELIAQLEAPELVAQRAEAQSKVQAAQAQLGAVRSKADADTSTFDKLKSAAATPGVVAGNDLVLAQKAVEADQNQVASAEQSVEAARQALKVITQMEDYLRVTAPIDGVVTERNVHPGTLVGPNSGPAVATPIVRVVQTDRLRLVVPIPEAYTAGISTGSTIAFNVPAYPGQAFSGTVARIAQAVDVKTRTMAVELDVSNKDQKLNPGTYCQVKWPVHRATASLFVPIGSVATTTDRTFVIRVRNARPSGSMSKRDCHPDR